MEAEETVIGIETVSPRFPDYIPCAVWDVLHAQAEISFKAGEQLALEKQGQAYLEGKQAGIREVVEWLINDSYDTTIHFGEDWQAKLKEWGL